MKLKAKIIFLNKNFKKIEKNIFALEKAFLN